MTTRERKFNRQEKAMDPMRHAIFCACLGCNPPTNEPVREMADAVLVDDLHEEMHERY